MPMVTMVLRGYPSIGPTMKYRVTTGRFDGLQGDTATVVENPYAPIITEGALLFYYNSVIQHAFAKGQWLKVEKI